MIRVTRLRAPRVETRKTVLEGQTIFYSVKRSSRARHVRLEVRGETGLTVVIPSSYDAGQLPDLLSKKRQWVLEKLARHTRIPSLSAEKELESGDYIPYLGRSLKVLERHNASAADSVVQDDGQLLINLNNRNARLNLVVEWWYRQQAQKLIQKRADELSARLGVTYRRLCIRGAKTRWGSCSQKGNLNFNWKLMMAPEPVINYVIIHELVHLKEMNHSKKFGDLVAEHCPQWRRHKRWLKEHQSELAAKLTS